MLTGDNGILTHAQNSKTVSEKAEIEEQIKLALTYARMNDKNDLSIDTEMLDTELKANLGETGLDIQKQAYGELPWTVTKGDYTFTITEEGKILSGTANPGDAEDDDDDTLETVVDGVKIPEGFYHVAGTTKAEGLVISDVEGDDLDNSKGGNQFVWIPVTSEDVYVRNTTYEFTSVSEKAINDTDYLPEGIEIPEGKTEAEVEKELVVNAGGFYIGRFEAGKETVDGVNKVVSKKGATVWESIAQEDAKNKAKELIKNDNVKSGLITGIQWDVTMATVNGKNDGNGNPYNVTVSSSNRHVTETTSGQNEADRVYNIYDLEGNFWEYVAEKNNGENNTYVTRGGILGKYYASLRFLADGSSSEWGAFRLVLYVI